MKCPPIVFFSLGFRDDLQCAVLQARASNPKAEIVLLGDSTNNRFRSLVKHVNVYDHFEYACAFSKYYKHLSNNSHWIELLCYQRWFVLLKYMEQEGLESVFHVDTDVLIYSDVREMYKNYTDCAFNFAKRTSGHTLFINGVENLRKFCDFIMDVYTNAEKLARLEKIYADMPEGAPGGICDMTLIKMFCATDEITNKDGSEIIGDEVFDLSMNSPDGFLHNGEVKTIFWNDAKPYGFHTELQRPIRFNTLHFQGNAKLLMPHHVTCVLFGGTP